MSRALAILIYFLLAGAASDGASGAAESAATPPNAEPAAAEQPKVDHSGSVEASSAQRMPGAILFSTVFRDLDDPAILTRPGLPDEVARRIKDFAARARAFQSRLPEGDGVPGPETWRYEKRRHLERDLVALLSPGSASPAAGPGDAGLPVEAAAIEELAKAYAGQAILFYEWEGYSEGPLEEARFAEEFLSRHPATPLAPYLHLFLAHRFRCALEAMLHHGGAGPDEADAGGMRAEAGRKYRVHLETALLDPDPLVRFVAADLERRPFLYLGDLDVETPSVAANSQVNPLLNQDEATGGPEAAREMGEMPEKAAASPGMRAGKDGAGGTPGRTSGTACPDSSLPEPIVDPRAWARDCFALSAGPEAASPATLTELQADLDADGRPELLLGSTVDRGNAGGTHFVFQPGISDYRYLGSIFLHPRAFKVLPPAGDGRPRLLRYRRLGAGEGLLETVTYDGQAFVLLVTEKVFPQRADGERLAELFGGEWSAGPPAAPTGSGSQPDVATLSPADSGSQPDVAAPSTANIRPRPDVAAPSTAASGPLPQDAASLSTGNRPPLSLRKALELAEAYVSAKAVDLEGQYLHSVTLRYDEGARELYWHLQWMGSPPRLGGEFGLRVGMDGTVTPAWLGP